MRGYIDWFIKILIYYLFIVLFIGGKFNEIFDLKYK